MANPAEINSNVRPPQKFHRGNVKRGLLDSVGLRRRERNRGAPVAFPMQSIRTMHIEWGNS